MAKYRITSVPLDRPVYKNKLAAAYGTTWRTLDRQLREIYGVDIPKNVRLLFPSHVQRIVSYLGEPDS